MNKGAWWAWAIKNSVCLICWTALAIVFNKWWIALFAMLFMSSLSTETAHKKVRLCDKCGRHSPYADSEAEALEKAKEAGWAHFEDGNRDYCPECRRQMGI